LSCFGLWRLTWRVALHPGSVMGCPPRDPPPSAQPSASEHHVSQAAVERIFSTTSPSKRTKSFTDCRVVPSARRALHRPFTAPSLPLDRRRRPDRLPRAPPPSDRSTARRRSQDVICLNDILFGRNWSFSVQRALNHIWILAVCPFPPNYVSLFPHSKFESVRV